jgi:hypothetical protein
MRTLDYVHEYLTWVYDHVTAYTYSDQRDGYKRIANVSERHWPGLPPTLRDLLDLMNHLGTEKSDEEQRWLRAQMALANVAVPEGGPLEQLLAYNGLLQQHAMHVSESTEPIVAAQASMWMVVDYLRTDQDKTDIKFAVAHIMDMLKEVRVYAPVQEILAKQRQEKQANNTT